MPLQAGDRIGRYQIQSLLGVGGMGEVYRAGDSTLSRDVAIKMLTGETADDPGLRQRFEVEARAASTINHPNIVAVYDFGEQYGLLYIVWELVKGNTLRGVKFTPRQTAEIGAQIADGLAAAHAAGIIHRDLKPENILISDDGRAKILDFGLAKRTGAALSGMQPEEAAANNTQAQPGVLMGTIGYMSPEQIRSKDVDARSDIFSLGLVLYEMIAGHRAFQGDSAITVLNGILSMDPPDLGPEIPVMLRQIIGHCLEKNPDQRYQSARDLAFALHSLTTTGIGASGVHITMHEPETPLYKRRGFFAALAGIVTASAGAFFAGRYFSPSGGGSAPTFRPLTFEHGFVSNARFAPSGRNVVYSAGWRGAPTDIFTTTVETTDPKPTGLSNVDLFGVSSTGELAIATNVKFDRGGPIGSLARVPLAGGTPRTIQDNVTAAAWDLKGEDLAVVKVAGNIRRLEYPAGKSLAETTGWIRRARFSPDGSRIAFIDNPSIGDDRGSVVVVDLQGKRTELAKRASLRGLAWAPGGKEVWFAGSEKGLASNIEAVTLDGQSRTLLASPGGLSLEDVDQNGRALILRIEEPTEMVGAKGSDPRHIPLSWLEFSTPRALSTDGTLLAFTEGSLGNGSDTSVCVRKTDGSSPAVKLGDGDALALSSDAQRVLALIHSTPPQYVVYAANGSGIIAKMGVGVSQPRGALFHPDGKRMVFDGGDQLWIKDLGAGQARSFTSQGVSMSGLALSPDGQFAAATGPDGKLALFPIEGGASRPVQGAQATDRVIQWSGDSKSIFVYNPFQLPARIERLDWSTGKRDMLKEVMPSDPSGVRYFDLVMSADTSTAVLGLQRQLAVLQLVQGLK